MRRQSCIPRAIDVMTVLTFQRDIVQAEPLQKVNCGQMLFFCLIHLYSKINILQVYNHPKRRPSLLNAALPGPDVARDISNSVPTPSQEFPGREVRPANPLRHSHQAGALREERPRQVPATIPYSMALPITSILAMTVRMMFMSMESGATKY